MVTMDTRSPQTVLHVQVPVDLPLRLRTLAKVLRLPRGGALSSAVEASIAQLDAGTRQKFDQLLCAEQALLDSSDEEA